MTRLLCLPFISFFLCSLTLSGGERGNILISKVTISGYVKDNVSGEMLTGVTVIETNHRAGVSTNSN